MVRRDNRKCVGALVGGTLGDALGWPHEQRASAIGRSSGRLGFYGWDKRSGGRFQPYIEQISPGSYSDDTQLLLAVARARLSGDLWWEKLARVELPFWTMYERGGGGATLRAAKAHLKGTLPWEAAPAERVKYFNAGGNGVAMRISPHVMVEDRFSEIAKAVMADGVTTHGHPRALVGALCYAFGLSRAFDSQGTLAYGALIRETLDGVDEWSRLPDMHEYWPTWHRSTETVDEFHLIWESAVFEVYEALKLALRGLDAGALANDDEVLGRLGCFDRKINGAGTVAAAASLFLASKHAASPFEAVARAALAEGADTDTLASMCGGLAGAFAGIDWLGTRVSDLQDLMYIDKISVDLAAHAGGLRHQSPYRGPFDIKSMDLMLADLRHGKNSIDLPIGGEVRVERHDGIHPGSPNVIVEAWKLSSNKTQTLYIKKIGKSERRVPAKNLRTETRPLDNGQNQTPNTISRVTVLVRNLRKSRDFYTNALNLGVAEETSKMLCLGRSLWLRQAEENEHVGGASLYIDVSDLEGCYMRVKESSALRVSNIITKGGKRAFACQDVDGHRLEVFGS